MYLFWINPVATNDDSARVNVKTNTQLITNSKTNQCNKQCTLPRSLSLFPLPFATKRLYCHRPANCCNLQLTVIACVPVFLYLFFRCPSSSPQSNDFCLTEATFLLLFFSFFLSSSIFRFPAETKTATTVMNPSYAKESKSHKQVCERRVCCSLGARVPVHFARICVCVCEWFFLMPVRASGSFQSQILLQ